jgi:hypothetical protein
MVVEAICATIRAINEQGLMGTQVKVKVVLQKPANLTVALKASSRFIPKDYYDVEILVEGNPKITLDVAEPLRLEKIFCAVITRKTKNFSPYEMCPGRTVFMPVVD